MNKNTLAIVAIAATALAACADNQKPAESPSNITITSSPSTTTQPSDLSTTSTTTTTAPAGASTTSASSKSTASTPSQNNAPYNTATPGGGNMPNVNAPPTEIPGPSPDRSNATNNNGNNGINNGNNGINNGNAVNNSNSHDASNAQTPSGGSGSITAMDQGNSDAERKITADIRKTVVADRALSFSAKNVTIVTIGSKVTLKGSVKSEQEKSTVERYAKRTAGVTDVDNQLEVKK